ncbi:MAG TPA: thiamine phosphate synthase [Verrucomicrobiales bacterium]|nr:thiamine phosphate synthase [Verrucomicrobiales bacterium]
MSVAHPVLDRAVALYTFVDTAYLGGRPVEAIAEQLCAGGSDLIQLRAKGSSPAEVRSLAERIHPITSRAGVPLVINDHPGIAADLGVEFCHLGQEDFFDAGHTRVGELPGGSRGRPVYGLSTHAPEQAARAVAAGPAYIAIGPVYPTGTKPGARPVTLDYVRWAATNVSIPWFAIGGITLANLGDVMEAGARRICVVSAILNAPDIPQACQEFKTRLLSSRG